jgi:hypothetical protein
MNTKIITVLIAGAVLLVVGWLLFVHDTSEPGEINGPPTDRSAVEAELEGLPYEVEVHGRSVTFDKTSVSQTPRDAYAQLPYTVSIGDEARLIESHIVQQPGETPLEFAERAVAWHMPSEEELEIYPDTIYQMSVSLYPMFHEEVSQYPMADEVTPAEEGVSAYIRLMNLPDDSVGGTEHRYDLIASNGGWIFVWHGERSFCRRPDSEFWQPADQLCP